MTIDRQDYLRRVNAILTDAFHAQCPDLASRITNALEACITKPGPIEADIERLVAVSTGHMPPKFWTDDDSINSSSFVVYPIEYGALLWIPSDESWEDDIKALQGESPNEYDEYLKVIVRWAREHNIRWVKFDCDAVYRTDLPDFDQEG